MREIKFRAWDKWERKMFPWELLCEQTYNYLANYSSKKSNWDLMQYTGFANIKNQEIYDGDIIKTKENDLFIVKWNEEYGCWVVDDHFLRNKYKYCTVLGNVYENPEILR